ncbi:tetratricopeptide repeat protein [Omnitrophica bacterium]|nr:tetratricopeptide repeat protein [Candidatus Omnitrophota bacterium]
MITKRTIVATLFLFIIHIILSYTLIAFAQQQEGTDLEKGIWHYRHENFEEALALLKPVREEDPDSSLAAYYLGITYKKLQDYKSARPHLEAAVTLKPKIKGALIELIDLLYKLDEVDEAKKWVAVAEEEGIRPGQTALLKGLTLLKEGADIDGAVTSLRNARDLNYSLAQVVNYHIGVARLKSKKLKEAKDIFDKIVKEDPESDLAVFAQEYLDLINNRLEEARPVKLAFGTFYQYDSNVTLKPVGDVLATRITDDRDNRMVYTGSAEVNLRFFENLGTRMAYAYYYGDQLSLDTYDVFSQVFAVQPTIYLKDVAIIFPASYDYLRVDDREYLNSVNLGNLTSIMLAPEHMLQAGFTYKKKDFKWELASFDENRDAHEYIWQLAHHYFFTNDRKGFVTVKHEMNVDDTKGKNWEYFGNHTSVSSVIPLHEKMKLALAGKVLLHNFFNRHTAFGHERRDTIFQLSSLFSFEIVKGTELQLQYTYINNGSNIKLYDYTRNVYSAGVQFKF